VDYYTALVCPLKPPENGDALDQQLLIRMEHEIINWLREYAVQHHCKFMAAGIGVEEGDVVEADYSGKVYLRRTRRVGRLSLPSRLWFELDIVPFILRTYGEAIDERACSAVRKALMYLNINVVANLPRVSVGYRHQVFIIVND
jgi:hypothetical protein